MSETTATIKDLKPGNFVMIDDEPCKVVGRTKSKPGKHGASKIRLEAMGIFDNRRRFLLKPSSATVSVPVIEKKSAQVISVSGDIAQVMDSTDYSTFDVSIPEEFKGKIEAGKDIMYWRIGTRILINELR
jgi:translation initiation factor 5A